MMARPTTKNDLINFAEKNYQKLMDKINSLSVQEQNKSFAFEDRDKNIRDLLIHLYEWHLLWMVWVKENQKGNEHSFLPEPYNWRTYPTMNEKIWKKHQTTSLEEAKASIDKTHQEIMQMIDGFSNQELFSKGVFAWTGGTTLGSYSASVTSSHYLWALKKLNRHIKSLKAS